MLYLDIFGRIFEKSFIFETSTLKFVLSESLVQKYKYLSQGQKSLLWLFLDWNFKMVLSYLLLNLLDYKLLCKNKNS